MGGKALDGAFRTAERKTVEADEAEEAEEAEEEAEDAEEEGP
jgi:hypothetical protein